MRSDCNSSKLLPFAVRYHIVNEHQDEPIKIQLLIPFNRLTRLSTNIIVNVTYVNNKSKSVCYQQSL